MFIKTLNSSFLFDWISKCLVKEIRKYEYKFVYKETYESFLVLLQQIGSMREEETKLIEVYK